MIAWSTGLLLILAFAGPPELPAEAPPTEAPADPDAPIEIRAPEQVQQDVEQGKGEIATPEQVHDRSAATPRPPDPKAHPSEGVYAVGSGPVAPLPPPPPPVPTSAIAKFDWRGVMWLSVRLTVTGPIGGNYPARTGVIALGGGLEGGWRINQIAGLGLGLYRQPHEIIRTMAFDETILRRGTMSNWDVAFLRLFAPVRGRVDPYVDLGGGLAFLEPAREGEPLDIGGTLRVGLGFDAWIAKNLTFGVSGLYRAAFMDDSIGHAVQGAIDLSVHW